MTAEKTENNSTINNILLALGFGLLAIGNSLTLFTDYFWIPVIMLSIAIVICATYIYLQFKN